MAYFGCHWTVNLEVTEIDCRVILGLKFNSQVDKSSPLVSAFCHVLDIMPIGNEYRDLISTYSPIAKYQRWKAEQ